MIMRTLICKLKVDYFCRPVLDPELPIEPLHLVTLLFLMDYYQQICSYMIIDGNLGKRGGDGGGLGWVWGLGLGGYSALSPRHVAHFTCMDLGPVSRKTCKNKNKTKQKQQTCNNFVCLFVCFSQGTSLAEAANTVFVSAKQSMSSVPDMRTGKEN